MQSLPHHELPLCARGPRESGPAVVATHTPSRPDSFNSQFASGDNFSANALTGDGTGDRRLPVGRRRIRRGVTEPYTIFAPGIPSQNNNS